MRKNAFCAHDGVLDDDCDGDDGESDDGEFVVHRQMCYWTRPFHHHLCPFFACRPTFDQVP